MIILTVIIIIIIKKIIWVEMPPVLRRSCTWIKC